MALVASFTVTVTVKFPATVGTPEIVPVDALIVRPAGRPTADHVYGGVPLAGVSGALYATVSSPSGRFVVPTTGTGLIVIA